jgi:hypothetical protein
MPRRGQNHLNILVTNDVNTSNGARAINVLDVDVARNVKDALGLNHQENGRVVHPSEADGIDLVHIGERGDSMDDTIPGPVLKGEVLNRQGHKNLVLEEESVGSLIMALKENSVVQEVEGSMVDGPLTVELVSEDEELGPLGGGNEANTRVTTPHLESTTDQVGGGGGRWDDSGESQVVEERHVD